MKHNQIICNCILALLLLAMVGCVNEVDNTVNPVSYYAINGTLYAEEIYSGTKQLVLVAGRQVYIRVDTGVNAATADTSNSFYSVTTSATGKYTFYVTDASLPYRLFTASFVYASSSSFAPLYYATATTTGMDITSGNSIPLVAYPDTARLNGLNLTTVDSADEMVGHSLVKVYTSRIVALSDSKTFASGGPYKADTTDPLGRAFIGNLPSSDTLYINARYIPGKDTLQAIAVPVFIPANTIISKKLHLIKVT